MPSILRRLPFFEDDRTLRVPVSRGPVVAVRHHQIIVWVSVTPAGLPQFPAGVPRIPAVLDTGFNYSFLIQEQHLRDWTGATLDDLTEIGGLSVYGRAAPLHDADVWIHANRPGFRDEFSKASPFRLELRTGIAVSPLPGSPRLPLLGNLALSREQLLLSINYRRRYVSLRTAP